MNKEKRAKNNVPASVIVKNLKNRNVVGTRKRKVIKNLLDRLSATR